MEVSAYDAEALSQGQSQGAGTIVGRNGGSHRTAPQEPDPVDERHNYLPAFELNCYICLDALLAQIAYNFEISEALKAPLTSEELMQSHLTKYFEYASKLIEKRKRGIEKRKKSKA